MSKWGVFYSTADGVPPHVMPVGDDMFAINGHVVSDQCWCKPERRSIADEGYTGVVIVHNDKGRGGCNA